MSVTAKHRFCTNQIVTLRTEGQVSLSGSIKITAFAFIVIFDDLSSLARSLVQEQEYPKYKFALSMLQYTNYWIQAPKFPIELFPKICFATKKEQVN